MLFTFTGSAMIYLKKFLQSFRFNLKWFSGRVRSAWEHTVVLICFELRFVIGWCIGCGDFVTCSVTFLVHFYGDLGIWIRVNFVALKLYKVLKI